MQLETDGQLHDGCGSIRKITREDQRIDNSYYDSYARKEFAKLKSSQCNKMSQILVLCTSTQSIVVSLRIPLLLFILFVEEGVIAIITWRVRAHLLLWMKPPSKVGRCPLFYSVALLVVRSSVYSVSPASGGGERLITYFRRATLECNSNGNT